MKNMTWLTWHDHNVSRNLCSALFCWSGVVLAHLTSRARISNSLCTCDPVRRDRVPSVGASLQQRYVTKAIMSSTMKKITIRNQKCRLCLVFGLFGLSGWFGWSGLSGSATLTGTSRVCSWSLPNKPRDSLWSEKCMRTFMSWLPGGNDRIMLAFTSMSKRIPYQVCLGVWPYSSMLKKDFTIWTLSVKLMPGKLSQATLTIVGFRKSSSTLDTFMSCLIPTSGKDGKGEVFSSSGLSKRIVRSVPLDFWMSNSQSLASAKFLRLQAPCLRSGMTQSVTTNSASSLVSRNIIFISGWKSAHDAEKFSGNRIHRNSIKSPLRRINLPTSCPPWKKSCEYWWAVRWAQMWLSSQILNSRNFFKVLEAFWQSTRKISSLAFDSKNHWKL